MNDDAECETEPFKASKLLILTSPTCWLSERHTLEQKAIRAGTSLSGPLGSSLCACLVNKDSIALLCLLITVHGKWIQHNKVVPSHLTRCLITSVDLTHTCKPHFIPYCEEMSSRLSGRALIQWLESGVKRQNHQNLMLHEWEHDYDLRTTFGICTP